MGARPLHRGMYWGLTLLPALPGLQVLWLGLANQLGPDPANALVHESGRWALNCLLFTLCVTPLQARQPWQLLPLRRTLGLYTLGYALLHLLAYYALILGGSLATLGEELVKRPYIVVGALALLMLLPLGVTSTRGWQRRLGRRWKTLHRLVYVIAPLAVLHFAWQIKDGIGWESVAYGTGDVALMLLRRRPSSGA